MACLFCRIVEGDIPATILYQGEGVTAFRDINPLAPTHVLVVMDEHLDGAAQIMEKHETMVGRLIRVAVEIARQEGIADDGYRLIINQGAHAGQSVDHLHLHLLGGRQLARTLG